MKYVVIIIQMTNIKNVAKIITHKQFDICNIELGCNYSESTLTPELQPVTFV